LDVGKATSCAPVRRLVRERPDVADLVGELEDLRTARFTWRVFCLEALALFRGEGLVIGYFLHERPDILAETFGDLLALDVLISAY